MAGGKQTPRQKMINLMYLVFIAMLALNMSKEVLAAFGAMNKDFIESSDRLLRLVTLPSLTDLKPRPEKTKKNTVLSWRMPRRLTRLPNPSIQLPRRS